MEKGSNHSHKMPLAVNGKMLNKNAQNLTRKIKLNKSLKINKC